MARKSNKTAHVLNLLSGGEPEKETQQPQKPEAETAAETAAAKAETEPEKEEAASAQAAAPVKAQTAAPEVPSNISIIDNGAKEADLVAERIHEELLKELEKEEGAAAAEETVPAAKPSEAELSPTAEVPAAEALASPVQEEPKAEIPAASDTAASPAPAVEEAEASAAPMTVEPKAETPSAPIAEEPKTKTSSAPMAEEPKTETSSAPIAEEPKPEPAASSEPEQEEPQEVLELSPEPLAEPEPDYVMLNVMQRVVEDKIIYFMKQFEVCTCARCKADTIALTLSGLPAKYKIVDRFAVDPLVSYYTSRLISQVTVEALKACTQVKENPRH
ncbi:late competence development ComFB family protein [Candidatus Merdisoma sp. JLR.KK011]|uniref:late competence development ComFB family protein n=1 Tax=Candidatus Merdisoma sp. JLR.KK011 TaxID=3114299 RepID=UPI002FF0A095